MPIATAEQYAAMLDGAASGAYAFPAVNVSSSQTLNAALRGFAEASSGRAAEAAMAARVSKACEQLESAGRSLLR